MRVERIGKGIVQTVSAVALCIEEVRILRMCSARKRGCRVQPHWICGVKQVVLSTGMYKFELIF